MLQTARMPHVRFYTEAVEQRDKDGHLTSKDVYFAEVTPAGGRDSTIKIVDDWLAQLQAQSHTRGAFDAASGHYQDWFDRLSKAFAAFKQGNSLDVDGTSIKSCAAFTKADIANCVRMKIFTLEQLAEANEETLGNIGTGSRSLKNTAIKILGAGDSVKLAEENTALRVRMTELEEKMKTMIEAGLKEPAKRGRPAKE